LDQHPSSPFGFTDLEDFILHLYYTPKRAEMSILDGGRKNAIIG
jgi:hypothetical protein